VAKYLQAQERVGAKFQEANDQGFYFLKCLRGRLTRAADAAMAQQQQPGVPR